MSQSCSLVEEMLVCTVKKMHCCMCLQNRVGVNYHAAENMHKTVSSHQYEVDLPRD